LLPKDQVSSVPKCSFFYQGFDLACIPDEGRIEILNNLQHIGCNESYKSDLGMQALLNGEPVTVVSFHRFHFSCSLYFSINFFISFLSTGQKIRQDEQDEQDYFIFHHGKS